MGQSQSRFEKDATAEMVVAAQNENRVKGKTVIVTGGNSGIGLESCRILAQAGANVVMTSRSVESGQKAAENIVAAEDGSLRVMKLDLADFHSIVEFVENLENEDINHIDVLLNNAGVMAIESS